MNPSNLRNKYFSKVFANLIGLATTIFSTRIITRSLGPELFGDFSYLNSFFLQLIPLLTFGTSFAFYTKLSQRQNEIGLFRFYRLINIIAFSLIFVFIYLSEYYEITDHIWPDQNISIIRYAAIFAILNWIVDSFIQVGDARGGTVAVERTRMVARIFSLFILLGLDLFNWLDLRVVYFYNFFSFTFIIFSIYKVINTPLFPLLKNWIITKLQLLNYFREFYLYTRPLFIYTLVGLVVIILERWLLQKFGGSIEQGFFSLSLKLGTIAFVFSNAATQLVTREFSIAFEQNDKLKMLRIFRRYIPVLFSFSTLLSAFFFVNASKVTMIIGGNKFEGAVMPIAIMALYPIHQTYGQLSGSLFYASGNTKLYSKIGIMSMLIGFPLSYILVAPDYLYGLDTGATGLAIKFIVLQFITVNIQLFFNSRFLGFNFTKYFLHQLGVMTCLLGIASIVNFAVIRFEIFAGNTLVLLVINALIYFFLCGILILLIPRLFGLFQSDSKFIKRILIDNFRKKSKH